MDDSESDNAHDDPFNISEDLVPSRTQKSAGTLILDFDGLVNPPLRLHEDLKEGNGGQAWPAGMLLAKYLLRHRREEIEGKSIIELGAGGGLVGLALAVALRPSAATPIHITDLEPMLPLMKHNIALNLPSGASDPTGNSASIIPSVYSWGSPPHSQLPIPPDVVLAADCVYFEPAFPLLLQTLKDLIGEKTVCWFCFKRRRRADMGFARELRKAFVVEETEPQAGEEDWRRENLHLYQITRKQSANRVAQAALKDAVEGEPSR